MQSQVCGTRLLIENNNFRHGRQHIHSWGARSSSGGRKEKEEEGPDVSMLFEHAFAHICIYIYIYNVDPGLINPMVV